jgi:hypothetical protein
MKENKQTKLYKIERLREPMSREQLEKVSSNIRSDENCITYHLEHLDDIPRNKKVVVLLDTDKNDKGYVELKPIDAKEYFNEYLDMGKANAKPKEVMRIGYSQQSKENYDKLVKQENEETKYINEFTMPTFDELWDNIYVNTYNGDIYNDSSETLPDELREDVGVIVPGIIDRIEDYFDFVKRLKDRGKDGLGRSIYDKYEDYLEATEIIGTYIEAVYDKYGGKEEFYQAKDIGGVFGGYEYIPTVKPRYKKSRRNIRLAKGEIADEIFDVDTSNLGALISKERDIAIQEEEASNYYVHDDDSLGSKLRKESIQRDIENGCYEEEFYDEDELIPDDNIDSYIVIDESDNEDFDSNELDVVYELPPRFTDLPKELDDLYKTGLVEQILDFKPSEKYAELLMASDNKEDAQLGRELLSNKEAQEIIDSVIYESTFTDMLDSDSNNLPLDSIIDQLSYDKIVSKYGSEKADMFPISESSMDAYRNFIKNHMMELDEDKYDLAEAENYADYKTKYMYNPNFKQLEDEKNNLNRSANDLLRNNNIAVFGENNYREELQKGETEIEGYLREMSSRVRASLNFLTSNADTDDYTGGYKTSMATDYNSSNIVDKLNGEFEIPTSPQGVLKYAENNIELAQRIYEFTVDHPDDARKMFSDRCSLEDFVSMATKESKPMFSDKVISEIRNKNKRKLYLVEGGNKNNERNE